MTKTKVVHLSIPAKLATPLEDIYRKVYTSMNVDHNMSERLQDFQFRVIQNSIDIREDLTSMVYNFTVEYTVLA